jgi:hypothetical protein
MAGKTVARLTDRDVARLITRLANEPLSERAPAIDSARQEDAIATNKASRERLRELSADGSLGPILTQRLAAYLGKPVRCTSGGEARSSGDGPLYVARSAGVTLWLRMETLLAGALADAMIGGEGDAPKVGFGTKVARVAAGAAAEMIGAVAAALGLDQPSQAELYREVPFDLISCASGGLLVAMQDYAWEAGLTGVPAREPEGPGLHEGTPTAPPAPVQRMTASSKALGLDDALERARQQLEAMLGAAVTFDAPSMTELEHPLLPQGWLRTSLASRGGGAIVLSVDRLTAAALVNGALHADIVAAGEGGTLMEVGSEVIACAALRAFADALGSTPDELHHIVRLGDDAILADLPHRSVEHRVTCRGRAGRMRWLVPERMVAGTHASTSVLEQH